MAGQKAVTTRDFATCKRNGRKISMLTAYDYPTAKIVDESGVDAILVGDSLSMVVQGHSSTVPVTLDQMIYHGEMVCRAVERALVVVDMPFGSYHEGRDRTMANAVRIMKETGCQSVKLEGGRDQATTIAALVNAGIPVMGHVGLRPQQVHQSGYRVQRDKQALLDETRAVADAGAFAIVVECIPAEFGRELAEAVSVPTIGIGAGPDCDGQVLVLHDLLGITSGYVPSFVKKYANLAETISAASKSFSEEVRNGVFPDQETSY